jgi:hypothetical protein
LFVPCAQFRLNYLAQPTRSQRRRLLRPSVYHRQLQGQRNQTPEALPPQRGHKIQLQIGRRLNQHLIRHQEVERLREGVSEAEASGRNFRRKLQRH